MSIVKIRFCGVIIDIDASSRCRVRDLKRLPFGLSAMPSVVVVRDLYAESFARIRYVVT